MVQYRTCQRMHRHSRLAIPVTPCCSISGRRSVGASGIRTLVLHHLPFQAHVQPPCSPCSTGPRLRPWPQQQKIHSWLAAQIDCESRAVLRIVQLHEAAVNALAVHEHACFSAADDGQLRMWPADFSHISLEASHTAPVTAVCSLTTPFSVHIWVDLAFTMSTQLPGALRLPSGCKMIQKECPARLCVCQRVSAEPNVIGDAAHAARVKMAVFWGRMLTITLVIETMGEHEGRLRRPSAGLLLFSMCPAGVLTSQPGPTAQYRFSSSSMARCCRIPWSAPHASSNRYRHEAVHHVLHLSTITQPPEACSSDMDLGGAAVEQRHDRQQAPLAHQKHSLGCECRWRCLGMAPKWWQAWRMPAWACSALKPGNTQTWWLPTGAMCWPCQPTPNCEPPGSGVPDLGCRVEGIWVALQSR